MAGKYEATFEVPKKDWEDFVGLRPRSVVGVDPGLAHCGLAHVVRTMVGALPPGDPLPDLPEFALCEGHVPCSGVFTSEEHAGSVAESNAHRAHELLRWLDLRLSCAVSAGAEVVAAERYEHLRQASSAAKLSAAHAVLVASCAHLEPRPRLQAAGCGCPQYASARAVKRAVTGCDVSSKRVVEAAVARLVSGARVSFEVLRKLRRAGDVEHLADASAVALHALGCRVEPIYCARSGEDPILLNLPPRTEVLNLPEDVDGRALIVAGPWARKVLGLKAAPVLAWQEVRLDRAHFMAAVLPGAGDRFWKSPANAHRAKLFLRAATRPT